jgi:hypothetical protein
MSVYQVTPTEVKVNKFEIQTIKDSAGNTTPLKVRAVAKAFPETSSLYTEAQNPKPGTTETTLYLYRGGDILDNITGGTKIATRVGNGAWLYETNDAGNYIAGASLRQTLADKTSGANKSINNNIVDAFDGVIITYTNPVTGSPIRMTKLQARTGLGLVAQASSNPNDDKPIQPGLRGARLNPGASIDSNDGGNGTSGDGTSGGSEASSTQANVPPQTVKPAVTVPPPVPTILRYPLSNLDVAREFGITYDYIKIKVVDHISSLDLDRLTGNTKTSTGRPSDYGNQYVQNYNKLSQSQTLSRAYFASQATYSYIILPMQPNLSSTNSTDWGSDSANILQLVAGSIFNSFYKNVGREGLNTDQLGKLKNDILQGGSSLIQSGVSGSANIAALLAGQTVGTNLLTRATGTVVNPNLEMLFNGPRLRTFNFSFDLTPRFKEEAKEIRKIIRILKKYMAPAQHDSNAFLKAPKIFLLEYIYNGDISEEELQDVDTESFRSPKAHPYLNKIKPCALTDLNVNYTPDGSYMTYRDGGSMTKYTLNMSFSEIEPVYQNDYGPAEDDFNPPDPGF